MEIRVKRELFYKTVSKVQGIIEKRSNMPILSTVLINAIDSQIILTATDLQISIQKFLEAEIISSGSITISGKKLFDILKESKSKEIYIKEMENNWILIEDDTTKYQLAGISPNQFPAVGEYRDIETISIDGDILDEMIKKTIFSVSMEDTGYKLSGVYIEKIREGEREALRMVSTDGHRLSLIDREIEEIRNLSLDQGILIPKKGMSEIQKLVSEGGIFEFGIQKNACLLRGVDTILYIRLLDARFPDYRKVIPKEIKYRVSVRRDILLNAMKKAFILVSEVNKGVKMVIEDNVLELISINPELGNARENIPVQYQDSKIDMGYNAKYFIDVLQAMESKFIEIGFIDDLHPCVITGKEDIGFLALIMPMRIPE